MNWLGIACIVFSAVTANHLGLVKAIEEVADRELKIVNCPRCLTFWGVLAYSVVTSREAITSLAVSFLASYAAIWLELFEGFIDSLYQKCYEKIYPNSDDDTTAADGYKSDTDCPVSQL